MFFFLLCVCVCFVLFCFVLFFSRVWGLHHIQHRVFSCAVARFAMAGIQERVVVLLASKDRPAQVS